MLLRSSVGTATATVVAAESRGGSSVGADCGVGDGAERGSAIVGRGGLAAEVSVWAWRCFPPVDVAMGVGNGDVWLFDPTGGAGGTVGGADWVG